MPEKKPLLLIFLDGLRPESTHKLDILGNLPEKRRLKGEFGYSIACHASMYTGLPPQTHRYWFVWQRRDSRGVFRGWSRFLGLPGLDNWPLRVLLHKLGIRKLRKRNTSFFGIPRPIHVRMKDLAHLTVTEWKNYDEYGYIEGQKGFLDIMRDEGLRLDLVGFDKSFPEESKILESHKHDGEADVTYWFLGDVDHFSHRFGQLSPQSNEEFEKLNAVLNAAYDDYCSAHGAEPEIVAWSDHGHADVKEMLDPYAELDNDGVDLNRIFHVIDGTFIRLWRRGSDQKAYEAALRSLRRKTYGFFLEGEMLSRFELEFDDDRFGDDIFSLKPGWVYDKTIWGWSRTMQSQHGYCPDEEIMDGVLAASFPLAEGTVSIRDIYSTVLGRLNLARYAVPTSRDLSLDQA